MYIKILVYIIDNQQFKLKISILFSDRWLFSAPICRPLWIGGGWSKKRQPGRADFGEVVRPAYPLISLHVRHPNISQILLYLRHN
nr:MAG TPA: hypothetical protein [Caudoviricetes sp.]